MQKILELKKVNELQKYDFFIPAYQRGYRWGINEINELLNDISEFTPKIIDEETNEKTWYCLQPIVVKEYSENTYEVIDGQQRLTTIFLILHYLNQDFVENRRDRLFTLDYETREDSDSFLKFLEEGKTNDDNIDFFYISEAYNTICKWFNNQNENFDKGNFRSKIKFDSKVIWYLSDEKDSISIFTRINIGKIPLTNAELIKALFLNSSNFKRSENKLKLKQLEIATEWDTIEFSLQNDRFWFFLNQNLKTTNRIEFIFDLMNDENDENDPYSTFRFFNRKFKSGTNDELEQNWSEIKRYYQRFNEWYSERELYHKIGFLVSSDISNIRELYSDSDKFTKTDFLKYIDDLIVGNFKGINISDLQYSDGKIVKKVLLLYNILTILSSHKDNSYFPFDLYKNEKWDIEHIASIKSKIPEQNRLAWVNEASQFIENSEKGNILKKEIEGWISKNDENDGFIEIHNNIVEYFNEYIKDSDDINDLSNLTLLDSGTNRGYKNAVFPLKRKTIIDRDKAGVFIPICTKNVFLKYFSEYPPKISFWSEEDRQNYEMDLRRVLETYLN